MKFFTYALPLLFAATALAAPSPVNGADMAVRQDTRDVISNLANIELNKREVEELTQRDNRKGVVLQLSGSLIDSIANVLKSLLSSVGNLLTGDSGTKDDSIAVLNQLTGSLNKASTGKRGQTQAGVLSIIDQLVTALALKYPDAKSAAKKLHDAVTELEALAAKSAASASS